MGLVNELENFDKEFEQLKHDYEVDEKLIAALKRTNMVYQASYKHIHPVKVYYTPSRGNTTVIFEDGSSETVKRKSGEKDCIDTAIAYALMKHVFPKEVIKELKKHIEKINSKK